VSEQGVRPPGAAAGEDVWSRVGIGAVLATLGACGLVSLAGACASVLGGGGWRWTPLADSGRALVALARDPGHPAAAYPERVAAEVCLTKCRS